MADHAVLPAIPGFDEKIVFAVTVSAHFAERHAKIFSRSLWRSAKLPKPAIAAC
jgi:hypothetical protein